MEVLRFPNPHLFIPCKEVTVFDSELKSTLESMWETMIKSNGIGLAANQVGLDRTMFTMLGPEKEKLFIINPKIISISEESAELREGCLSAPDEFLLVPTRRNIVQIIYRDETGGVRTGTFRGIHAVCVQHEMQHLDGESYMQSKGLSRQIKRQLARKWGIK
jgi:peptide deformylase